MAEIVRAGIISVDEGQGDAARALGMTRLQTMRRVVLPQAMRVIIPPTGNETISMLKTTSLVSVIAVADLLYAVADHLRDELQDDPPADRGEHLVPGLHERPLRRPVLPRALLRPGLLARTEALHAALRGCSRFRRTRGIGRAGVSTDEHADGPGRGRPQALRPQRGAARASTSRWPGRSDVPARSVGLREVDVPALHQPPREDQLRAGCRSTASWSATARRARCCTSCANRRSPASGPRSAWSSSTSTCSAT